MFRFPKERSFIRSSAYDTGIGMMIQQISVFVENKKGRLTEITGVIAENGISIRALSIADTTDFGILRIIVDDPEKTERILRGAGLTVSITSVLAVKIQDRAGGLHEALKVLSDHDITVEYVYAFVTKSINEAYVVMRIEEDAKAQRLLKQAGFEGLSETAPC